MLHARIRTPHDAFHFIGEVTPYNLQTLRQHLRQSLREDGGLDVRVEVDLSDEVVVSRWAQRLFPQLTANGARVRIDVRRPDTALGHPAAVHDARLRPAALRGG